MRRRRDRSCRSWHIAKVHITLAISPSHVCPTHKIDRWNQSRQADVVVIALPDRGAAIGGGRSPLGSGTSTRAEVTRACMERDSCAGGELTTYLWQLLALEVVLDTAPTTPDNNSASRLLLCKSLRKTLFGYGRKSAPRRQRAVRSHTHMHSIPLFTDSTMRFLVVNVTM